MKSLVFGQVIRPEIIPLESGQVIKFGLLICRESYEFTVFDTLYAREGEKRKRNPLFDKVVKMKDGDVCVCEVTFTVKENSLNRHLCDIAPIDGTFVDSIYAFFA